MLSSKVSLVLREDRPLWKNGHKLQEQVSPFWGKEYNYDGIFYLQSSSSLSDVYLSGYRYGNCRHCRPARGVGRHRQYCDRSRLRQQQCKRRILQQQGITFSGTAQFGDDAPFNINGVADKKSIHITGSSSIFDANISGQEMHRSIHGTGSRLQTDLYPSATVVFDLSNKEYNCTHSGGTVETVFCCVSAGNFPNLCAIGACGCPPDSSHEISTCNCGNNKCYNGNKCVSR